MIELRICIVLKQYWGSEKNIKVRLLVFGHDWNHTVSVYRHSNARSVRSRDHSPGSLHGIVEMKQYQQNYNSTPGPNTIDTHIKNQKSKEVVESVHVTSSYDTTFQPLPMSVINRVKVYVFFVGVARSGHSIVGAILDSHPHIVISNELNVFRNLLNLPDITKPMLFNKIWNTSYEEAVRTDKFGMHFTDKGYSLAVDGLHQGMYMTLTLMSSVIRWEEIQVLCILLTPLNLNIVLTSCIVSLTFPSKYFM